MRRYTVPILAALMVSVALAVLWLTTTTAYGPTGSTRCGPALQEWQQTFTDVAGRCHLARQERMRLGLAMGGLMIGTAVPVWWRSGRAGVLKAPPPDGSRR